MIISKFPRGGGGSSGEGGGSTSAVPVYTYTGEHALVTDEDGNWDLRLMSSGTLTLANRITAVIQAQGGGGAGGAGYNYGSGSDGADGSIESMEVTLEPGDYVISIGAAGKKRSDAAGGAGGDTSFGDLLTAAGGAGGAYKGGANVEHSGLYDTYGHGGEGGTTSQYTGSTTDRSYIKGTYAIYSAADPNSTITGYMTSGVKYYVSDTAKRGTDGKTWWVLDAGGYVPWASTSSAYSETVSDTRSWYGNAGNPGIIMISNKREAS